MVSIDTKKNKVQINIWGLGLWCLMPLSTIFISWTSVLLVKKIWVLRENHQSATSHWQTWSTFLQILFFIYFLLTVLPVVLINYVLWIEQNKQIITRIIWFLLFYFFCVSFVLYKRQNISSIYNIDCETQ
jgi:hypothetical protein